MDGKIHEIKTVDLELLRSNPPQVHIKSTAIASTNGWTKPRLVPYSNTPKNGIYEFDFIAQRPTQIANNVLTPIDAETFFKQIEQEEFTIRIHASNNFIDASLKTI